MGPGVTEDDRRAVAAEQAAVLSALTGGPVPPGFDGGRIALAARTLLNKRRRSVERRWPALAAVPGFAERFAEYAAVTPMPVGDAATVDGRRLFDHMRAWGGVGLSRHWWPLKRPPRSHGSVSPDPYDAARVELAVDRAARYGVAVTRLAGQRFAIAVRQPWPGGRVWVVRV